MSVLKAAHFCLRTVSFGSRQGQEPSHGVQVSSKNSAFLLENRLLWTQWLENMSAERALPLGKLNPKAEEFGWSGVGWLAAAANPPPTT